MNTLTKSPLKVARQALVVGAQTLRRYAHKNSPRKFTQPQLFACLVLKTFFKTDYRGVQQMLMDLPDLVRALRLVEVPHFTTLHKAAARLLRLRRADRLLTATVGLCHKRRTTVCRGALDSTGFQCGHASSYYVRRRSRDGKSYQHTTYRRFSKLELAVDCSSHVIIGAIPRRGLRVDTDRFVPLLESALRRVRLLTALADAGYDSEPNHRHAREKRGVKSFIPATAGRPTTKPPTGRYRRQMKQRLDKNYGKYGQRWQVETVISMIKRRLGSVVNARSYWSQCRELLLLAITHNVMLV
jgi:Transposase DDE domain